MQKPTLYILCGYAFSGKSTLAQKLVSALNLSLVGLDEINSERGLGQTTGVAISKEEWQETYRLAYKKIEELLRQGKNVIYDATNFTKEQRAEAKKIAENNGAASIIIFVDIPKEVALKRLQNNRATNHRFNVTDEDFTQVADNFEAPTQDENFIRYTSGLDPIQWIKDNFPN